MSRILVVEDDKKLGSLFHDYLEGKSYEVEVETRGDKAVYRILHEHYDLVILDINLPGLDGLQICKVVRKNYPGLILMITTRAESKDHITGLEYGADDYVTKPILPDVLLARIHNLLRRRKSDAQIQSILTFGKLVIDLEKRIVKLNNAIVELKPSEFELLALLALNAGTSLTRNNITLATRGIEYDGVDRTIDLRISYLRNKLNDNIDEPYRIKTIRGKGYVFQPDAWD